MAKVKEVWVTDEKIDIEDHFTCTLGVELEDGRYHEIDVESSVKVEDWEK